MSVVTATPPASIANAGTSDNRNVLLSVRDVQKVYGSREAITRALDDVSFDICEGEFVGVMGPSGSGKSTLLNCISTIDTVTSGSIILNGRDITQLRSRQLSKFRRDDLGFIFQDANLLDTLTGFENIVLALTIKGEKADSVRAKVDRTANLLGVADVLQKYPRQMSGGQRQRVAAARAIVADPKLVLADEPTGALDSRNAAVLLETLEVLNEKLHATIMMVTHDAVAASYAIASCSLKTASCSTSCAAAIAAEPISTSASLRFKRSFPASRAILLQSVSWLRTSPRSATRRRSSC